MKIIIACLLFLWGYSSAIGQYQAPTLACVYNTGSTNIIEWRPPNENCGAFVEFYIYYSTNINGPYTLLTTITNINVRSYTHTGITATTYYYMTSKYACTGASASSDTLSSATIPAPEFDCISIENGYPVYHWKPLTNIKNVWAYLPFQYGVGNGYIDTLIGRNISSYIDSGFNVSTGPYTGTIGATDSCWKNGKAPTAQATCFLSLVNNPCDDEIEISWTRYRGWGPNDEVKEYEIWVKKNSDPESIVSTNDSSTRDFRYKDFKYGDTLCIRVKAIHPTKSGIYSFSNQFCFVSSKSQTPTLLQTLSASYIDNYSVKLRWFCSLDAIPKSFDLTKYYTRNGQQIITKERINYRNDGKGYYSFTDIDGDYTGQTSYELTYEDLCNNESIGIWGHTNFLSVTQVGLYANEITWPERLFPNEVLYSVKKYELYFSPDMTNFIKLTDLTPQETKYNHNVESLYTSDGKFCYKLVAYYSFDTTTPIKDSVFTMNSQTKCILMRTVLWMPNAFKVNGVTPTFKPKMYFFSQSIFRMKIFDRWGKQIFETNDPNQGWNGIMSNGTMASEASYIYLITYQGNDGKTVEKTGTFILLR